MESMEKRVRQRALRGEIKTSILRIVAGGGIVSLAVMAPNMLKLLPRDTLKNLFQRPRNARDAAVSRLIAQKCLEREVYKGTSVLRITEKGRAYLVRTSRDHVVKKPKRWDGKWRVVIFDVSETRRNARNSLRRELQSIGFVLLQASVWAYPYPCEEFVALLKADAHIGKNVLYLVVEELENDAWLRTRFGLKI